MHNVRFYTTDVVFVMIGFFVGQLKVSLETIYVECESFNRSELNRGSVILLRHFTLLLGCL